MDFAHFLCRWNLVADGNPIHTHSSDLLPVRRLGSPAMLKVARSAEERAGNLLMEWWGGEGAATILEHDDGALLMERAGGEKSLAQLSEGGRDDEATRLLCSVAEKLHKKRNRPSPKLVPLSDWFATLWPAAEQYGKLLAHAADLARGLLESEQDITVLHGDIHHGNVLDFGPRGWLAIDPKGLVGDRGFEIAAFIKNPDVKTPPVMARRLDILCGELELDRERVKAWLFAEQMLNACWDHDGNPHKCEQKVKRAELYLRL